ncbi:hypothetical protein [Portibacter marinus]|uniref:hypothetical protein n=1 Tax=Portibacter marinus TaxID=2898660 RepID=UPI001F2E9E1F|nr:hypothetical protein [Portibacter marinus]
MWDFICELLPVIAFLTGTVLGGLIISFFNKAQYNSLQAQVLNASNQNIALANQLKAKERLEEDLARTHSEIEKLKIEFRNTTPPVPNVTSSVLAAENLALKNEIKNLKKDSEPKKDYVNDYQIFLEELEKSIVKARQKSFNLNHDKGLEPIRTEKKSKKKKKKTKAENPYDFYKNKYSGKTFSTDMLSSGFSESKKNKDLTYLYGITPEVQRVLNKHKIITFSDLASTKIAELKAMLELEGDQFSGVDPLNWPIQARIAEKGQWDILDEYLAKVKG